MSGALAPGKHMTMVAGVSLFTFLTIESPITRAHSSGFSVGASLSGENLFRSLLIYICDFYNASKSINLFKKNAYK